MCDIETPIMRRPRIDLVCFALENKWLAVRGSLRPDSCITFGHVLVCHGDSIVSTVPVMLEVHPLLFATACSVYFHLPSLICQVSGDQ